MRLDLSTVVLVAVAALLFGYLLAAFTTTDEAAMIPWPLRPLVRTTRAWRTLYVEELWCTSFVTQLYNIFTGAPASIASSGFAMAPASLAIILAPVIRKVMAKVPGRDVLLEAAAQSNHKHYQLFSADEDKGSPM